MAGNTFNAGGPKAAARGASATGNAVNSGERCDRFIYSYAFVSIIWLQRLTS